MKTQLSLPVVFFYCLLTTTLSAQTDSSQLLNAGRIQLDKDFTQTITIKGEDLEKVSFFSLQEAIDVWLYGIYTSKWNLAYVIDGVVANDVNAYSIYDIESITLVQNALIQLNGAGGQQQLLLITTRKGKAGSKGITAAGNTSYIKNDHLYHNYYLGAYNNTHKVRYGISANYLHEGYGKDLTYSSGSYLYKSSFDKSPNYNRFRFNGYIATTLGKQHDLTLAVNYAPQNYAADNTQYNSFSILQQPVQTDTGKYSTRYGEYVLNANLSLNSSFGKHLHNEFSVSYLFANRTGDSNSDYLQSNYQLHQQYHSTADYRTLFVRDNISYRIQTGNWRITPALNAQFSFPKSTKEDYSYSYTSMNSLPGTISWTSSKSTGKAKSYLLTPSLSIAYKNIVQIQGGILADVSPSEGRDLTRVFPFGTVTTDVLKMLDGSNKASLQLFGSFARYDNFSDLQYKLSDFVADPSYPSLTSAIFLPNPPPTSSAYNADQQYRIWETGVRFRTANNRFEFSYNFEKRDYTTTVIIAIPSGTNYYYLATYPDLRAYTHSFGIRSTVVQSNNFNWRVGLTATSISNTFKNPYYYYYANITGNLKSQPTIWVGGLTNRIKYKNLFAGADIQYVFNNIGNSTNKTAKMQVLFQNIYAGMQVPCKKLPGLELYISCRNFGDAKNTSIPAMNKYYGVGFKTSL
ncbi:MAG: hypothetical protein QM731_09310 [Chitinophagaceae bacterium]